MKSKILALFAIAVMALAATGTAYAAWLSTATINGTVAFGTLSLKWTGVSVESASPYVTVSSAWANDEHTAVTVTINNAYPGCYANIYCNTINAGSIPLKYSTFQITNDVDNRIDTQLFLGFYEPTGNTLNVQGSFRDFESGFSYASAGLTPYVTFAPGEAHNNLIKIWVSPDVNQEWMGYSVSATFALTAAVA